MTATVSREKVRRFRWHAQQLDRDGPATDCALLDLGVQDTGPDGAAWALHQRGVTGRTTDRDDFLAWTLRGAPHRYRRADLPAIAAATAPYSEADAAKRIYDASRPLKAAGISTLDALRAIAEQMRAIAAEPIVKGAMSAELARRMPQPYLRECRPCHATHLFEMPFRLAALQAGLVLQDGTSPPVLGRVTGWEPEAYAHLAPEADPRFDVIRSHLRFYGPTTPKLTAAYLDAPVREVTAHWPEDVVAVSVDGDTRDILAADLAALTEPPGDDHLRLLGPFDPYLQLKDRDVLVPDEGQQKQLWLRLGRPGVVAQGGNVLGVWRPRAASGTLNLLVQPWCELRAPQRALLDAELARLAAHRGLRPGRALTD